MSQPHSPEIKVKVKAVPFKAMKASSGWSDKLRSFLASHCVKVSGQLHAPAALSPRKNTGNS